MMIYYSAKLALAPVGVVNLAMEGHLELRKAHQHVLEFLTGEEQTLWACADSSADPSGVLLWSPRRHNTCWWVELAYVCPGERGTGVFESLRQEMYRRARNDGVQCIESIVSVDNTPVLRNYERRGLVPANHHFRVFLD